MPPRKTNNAAKFIVSLKQNNSERFSTINGLFTYKTTKFVSNALAQLWAKTRTSISRKFVLLCRVFKLVIK